MSISPGVLNKPCDGNQLIPGALNALKTGTLILYLFKTPPKPCPDSRRKAKKLVQTTGFTPNSVCSTYFPQLLSFEYSSPGGSKLDNFIYGF